MRRLAQVTLAALALAACDEKKAPPPPADHPVAAAPAPEKPVEKPAAPTGPPSDVTGTVTFAGEAPKLAEAAITKDAAICGKARPAQKLRVGAARGIADTVVWLTAEGAAEPAAPPAEIVVQQQACEYTPHLQAAAVGSKLAIVNQDPILHNVHGYGAQMFNIGQPTKGQRNERPLDKAGVVRLKCDVHSWMEAFVVVTPSARFAVTGEDGKFTLPGVPAGEWTLHVWHEGWVEGASTPIEKTVKLTVPAAAPLAIALP